MESGHSLKFNLSCGVIALVSLESSRSAAPPATGKGEAVHRRRQSAFASMTIPSTTDGTARVPVFMVASASEAKKGSKKATATKGDTSAAPMTAGQPPAWRSFVGNLAAGAVSGCAVEAALYPIDTIKTRMQAMIGGGGIQALLQSGGGKGLYAGIWGNLAGTAPASAIFISVYEPLKKWVQTQLPEERQFLGPIIAGASAGLTSSLVRVPTEVIKSRLQTKEFLGPLQAVKAILAKEGAKGLYAGYGAFLLRDLPFDAIEFVVYEQLKTGYSEYAKRDLYSAETSVIGAFAGGFTGLVTTPLDVLKTRLMTQGASGRYSSLLDATMTIAKTEGLGAFMRGWQPRLIWISLGGFVFFPVLEATKKYFNPEMTVTPLH